MSEHSATDRRLPAHPVAAICRPVGSRWFLTLEREFPQPIERVWEAVTHVSQIRKWAPFAPDRDLTSPGGVLLTALGPDATAVDEAEVLEAVAPTLLFLTWGSDRLRFELTPTETGTRLLLSQTFADRAEAPSFGAGWHLCLGVLELSLAGREVPAVVGKDAYDFGWADLEVDYRAALGDS